MSPVIEGSGLVEWIIAGCIVAVVALVVIVELAVWLWKRWRR